ncbi:diguanylate cyclase domain-containing protein [Desulfoluna spongiiphila]|uniref:Diguanylate cyclase (GGDEF) domain-containing protein n=1 Tax=Desulfoluna spongiiphila TaxID=419481 RepID=A0A1G5AMZ8_9BACT|nr:diguanylate cyclase [Desulfoluna spongiiphila]SCX79266.1 diguanylate cyclase (GGDEF) domain-containing protein [Desulfoluna spongiiphila]VVS90446.1 nucleotide cyclase [Desulfoluna spongiiphila]
MKRFTDSRVFIAGVSLVCFLLLAGGSEYLVYVGKERWQAREREALIKEAGRVRTLLESEVNTTMSLNLGLVIYVATNPEVRPESFETIARRLVRRTPHIRNIGLARDNVITHIYPLEGNEAAIGFRYRESQAQWPMVHRAIDTRRTVVAGPVELVQGGRAIISRSPIFLTDKESSYWGISSMVMDVDSLYAASGLMDAGDLRYALKGKDGMGAQGEVFYGDPALFGRSDAVQLPITLPVGSWILAAAPHRGASTYHAAGLIRSAGLGLSCLITAMLFALLTSLSRIRYLAHHDPITELPNIRYFEAYIKQLITVNLYKDEPFALFYVDLDRFKPINEAYGHKAGDRVLRDAARRLKEMAPEEKVVCRMAGDEFVVVLETVRTRDKAEEIAEEMTRLLVEPYTLDGRGEVSIDARVGVSLFPTQGVTSEILIREADLDLSLRKGEPLFSTEGKTES